MSTKASLIYLNFGKFDIHYYLELSKEEDVTMLEIGYRDKVKRYEIPIWISHMIAYDIGYYYRRYIKRSGRFNHGSWKK